MHHLRYHEAAECFEKAIKLKPLFQMSHYNKALCEQSLGEYEESLGTLRQLERIVEKHEWVPKGQMYNMMGFAEAQVGDKGKAREYYGKAVKDGFDEGRAEAYYNLGALQYEEEDYQAALDSFDNSLKISADLTKPKMLKALVLSDLNRHN
jgi:tetratricopeptide (TPR) repeat protein